MTQRHLVTRWLGALGLILSLVGLVSQTTSAQTLAETQQRANQGDALAQANLGVMYATGLGVPQDDVEALTRGSVLRYQASQVTRRKDTQSTVTQRQSR